MSQFRTFYIMVVLVQAMVAFSQLEGAEGFDVSPYIAQSLERSCIENFDSNTDYFAGLSDVGGQNSDFAITYHKSYKIVTARDPFLADSKYLLVQCGAPVPSAQEHGITGEFQTIEIPPVSYGVQSHTALSFFHNLGALDGFKFNPTAFDIPSCVNGKLLEGSGFCDATCIQNTWASMDECAVDILFDDGYSQVSPIAGKATVRVSEFNSKTVSDQFEWITYVSAFLNREAIAQDTIAAFNNRFSCLKSGVNAGGANFLFITFFSTTDKKFYLGSCDNYYCDYVTQLGGNTLEVRDGFSSLSAQEIADGLQSQGKAVDHIIVHWYAERSEGFITGPDFGPDKTLTELIQLIEGNAAQSGTPLSVYDLGDYNSWFYFQKAAPELYLHDLIKITDNGKAQAGMDFFFLDQYYPTNLNAAQTASTDLFGDTCSCPSHVLENAVTGSCADATLNSGFHAKKNTYNSESACNPSFGNYAAMCESAAHSISVNVVTWMNALVMLLAAVFAM